jgi:hypothetical protein
VPLTAKDVPKVNGMMTAFQAIMQRIDEFAERARKAAGSAQAESPEMGNALRLERQHRAALAAVLGVINTLAEKTQANVDYSELKAAVISKISEIPSQFNVYKEWLSNSVAAADNV